ncbi:hypothetical protein [Nocardia terpenica]|uniref:Uncharacterized protein n=1 Tax=Nocardia terpenica TaxID=455432 RepID=A0A164K848_9NOCA|nr:hypothetical protein [Nocardia terpenica]KZM71131.1 hypothetical protein AWN90_42220 [Nocardia terpenica]NQE89544.1 hypothetical protein [Nocardia terpenica]
MFAPEPDKIVDVDLDGLLGPGGVRRRQVVRQVAAALCRHGLTVHLIVLCHGQDLLRFATTARLCRSLISLCDCDPGVRLAVSYQGDPAPEALTAQLDRRVRLLTGCRALTHAGMPVPAVGKTEHLLSCLAVLLAEGSDPERQFVVFIDNDYVIYDPEDAFALYAPWALGFAAEHTGCSDQPYAGVSFAKGGSLRLAVGPELVKPDGERTWRFVDLLDTALARCVPHAPPVSERLPVGMVPTRETLRNLLGAGGFAELEAAVERCTKHGGRSSRALSLWLSSRRDNLVERWLARFSFLLHGDQGATLSDWAAMELAPGYGLEISFLINALFRPGLHTGRIVNALTLPHAHLPKDETDNFAMGVEMFALVQRLLHGMTSRTPSSEDTVPELGHATRFSHYAATKLGYKRVELTAPAPRVPALYPPVTELMSGRY